MTRLHHILGYVLVALIVLTAQSAAIARTMPDATGQMVLCTGAGPVMVYFDDQGEPTAPPHLCPDFALSLILGLDVGGGCFCFCGGLAYRAKRVGRFPKFILLTKDA